MRGARAECPRRIRGKRLPAGLLIIMPVKVGPVQPRLRRRASTVEVRQLQRDRFASSADPKGPRLPQAGPARSRTSRV
jgi:hypothetical protein